MLGGRGLSESTKLALLNANYIAHRLTNYYTLRYKNDNKRVAHELLIDLAEFDKKAGLKVTDFAKRLQVGDWSFSWMYKLMWSTRIMAFIRPHAPGRYRLACSSSQLSRNHLKSWTGEVRRPN